MQRFNGKYLTIERVGVTGRHLAIRFANGDEALVPYQELLKKWPGVNPEKETVYWSMARVGGFVLSVPTQYDFGFPLQWTSDEIRRVTDSVYAKHVAFMTQRQAKLLGKRLRQLRRDRNLSEQFVAVRLGVPTSMVHDIEHGDVEVLYAHLGKMLRVMGYTAGDLAASKKR